MPASIFWYDLETFGRNPRVDRIAQFAGIRTNEELEPVADPVVLYNKITPDYVPDPAACILTGITPQKTLRHGLNEAEFAARINTELSQPGTTVVGYNSIRFDDEFIRNLLYRNFHDPYEREYTQGNSRWDLLDVVRACHDLRPEGVRWPREESGRSSFRLERLSEANGLSHEHAHDALSDVEATIALAKLLKDAQPRLYRYAYGHRTKSAVKSVVDLQSREPLVFTSSLFTRAEGATALVSPVTVHPKQPNVIIAIDLRQDPQVLADLSAEEIRQRMFTRAELLTGERPAVTQIHINRAPFVAPVSVLDAAAAHRLGLDPAQAQERAMWIRSMAGLAQKLRDAFEGEPQMPVSDPDLQIYSGGFFSDRDRSLFRVIREAEPSELAGLNLSFQDPRVPEMMWRYIARNFPEVLSPTALEKWRGFCASRLVLPPDDAPNSLEFYRRKVAERLAEPDLSPDSLELLRELAAYGDVLERKVLTS